MEAEENCDLFDMVHNPDGTTSVIMKTPSLNHDPSETDSVVDHDEERNKSMEQKVSTEDLAPETCEKDEILTEESLECSDEKNIFMLDVSVFNISAEESINSLQESADKDKLDIEHVEALLEPVSIQVFASENSVETFDKSYKEGKNGMSQQLCSQVIHIMLDKSDEEHSKEDQVTLMTNSSCLHESGLECDILSDSTIEEKAIWFPQEADIGIVPGAEFQGQLEHVEESNQVCVDQAKTSLPWYQCGVCLRSFYSSYSCNIHMRLHQKKRCSRVLGFWKKSKHVKRYKKCKRCKQTRCKCVISNMSKWKNYGTSSNFYRGVKLLSATSLMMQTRGYTRASRLFKNVVARAGTCKEEDLCLTCEHMPCTCKTGNVIPNFKICKNRKCKYAPSKYQKVSASNNYECQDCGMRFNSWTTLVRHSKSHTTASELSNNTVIKVTRSTSNTEAMCLNCRQTTCVCRTDNVSGAGCNVCKQKVCQCGDLDEFLDLIETEEKLFKCDKCDKTFKTGSTLGRHMKNHSDLHNFTSSSPPKKLKLVISTKANTDNHDRVTYEISRALDPGSQLTPCKKPGNKPLVKVNKGEQIQKNSSGFICTHCGEICQYESILEMHLRVFHSNATLQEKSKLHSCAKCKRTFELRGELEVHLCKEGQVHSIDRDLAQNSKTEHVDDSNQLECPECGHSFPRKYMLEKHIQDVHSQKEKEVDNGDLYYCALCGAGLVHYSSLVRHIKTKH